LHVAKALSIHMTKDMRVPTIMQANNSSEKAAAAPCPYPKAAEKPQQAQLLDRRMCGRDPHHRDGRALNALALKKPIDADLHVGRELCSFRQCAGDAADGRVLAVVGNVAEQFWPRRDRRRRWRSYVGGMFMIAFATEGVMLTLGKCVVRHGMAAQAFGRSSPSAGRRTRENAPSRLESTTAGGSFGNSHRAVRLAAAVSA